MSLTTDDPSAEAGQSPELAAGRPGPTPWTPAGELLAAFDEVGIDHLVYIPCSTARPVLDRLVPTLGPRALVASVEMEAVAIGTGLALAGRRPLLMMQDTGLGNALTVLTTLPKAYHVPLVIFATRTGGLREINAVVHEYSDGVPQMLDACRIPHVDLDYRVPLGAWRTVMVEAARAARLSRRPVVVLADLKAGHPEAEACPSPPVRATDQPAEAGTLADQATGPEADAVTLPTDHRDGRSRAVQGEGVGRPGERGADPPPRLAHLDALRAIAAAFADDPLVASCGVSSRELASLGQRDNHLYLLNAMGAVGPTALGLALGLAGRPVVGIEGDGGFLMGLGALATIAAIRPRGLVWVVVDNGVHCSTGGQPTAASVLDLARLAEGAGLPTLRARTAPELDAALVAARRLMADGPVFLHVRTTPEAVPTPYFQPDAAVLSDRFQRSLGA